MKFNLIVYTKFYEHNNLEIYKYFIIIKSKKSQLKLKTKMNDM